MAISKPSRLDDVLLPINFLSTQGPMTPLIKSLLVAGYRPDPFQYAVFDTKDSAGKLLPEQPYPWLFMKADIRFCEALNVYNSQVGPTDSSYDLQWMLSRRDDPDRALLPGFVKGDVLLRTCASASDAQDLARLTTRIESLAQFIFNGATDAIYTRYRGLYEFDSSPTALHRVA